jgi:hypothetical protein
MRMSVSLALSGTLALAPVMPFATYGESVPVAAAAAVGEVTGTVVVVSPEKRMLTIRKPDGDFQVIHVPEEVKRLDEIKINDKLTISYLEAVAVDLHKGAAAGAPGAVVTKEVDREPGKKPAGSITETITLEGTVKSLNRNDSRVTISGPQQEVTLTVQDPSLLADLSVGDRVTATYIKAVAAKVE